MEKNKSLRKFEMSLSLKEKGSDDKFKTTIQIEAKDKFDAIDKISRLINKPIPNTINIKEIA